TVAGTSSAMVPQLALTALGMTALLGTLADWFEWLRWIGVAYLVWLGMREWRAPPLDLTKTQPEPCSPRRIYLRGLLVSLTNPKTLLFYSAFLPQFIVPGPDVAAQLALLAVTFVVIAVLFDGGWAVTAAWFRTALVMHGRLRNRLTGGLLVGA